MVKIRDLSTIAKKFVTKAVAASPDYEAGIRNPLNDYKSNTVASVPSFNAGVQAAIGRGAFGKGVEKAGTEKWQSKSISKGTQRYGPGVQDSEGDYNTGFGPYASTISSITLPAKGPKGSPGNIARVSAIANALRAKKTGGSVGGGGAV